MKSSGITSKPAEDDCRHDPEHTPISAVIHALVPDHPPPLAARQRWRANMPISRGRSNTVRDERVHDPEQAERSRERDDST